jgi:hypothetical protein
MRTLFFLLSDITSTSMFNEKKLIMGKWIEGLKKLMSSCPTRFKPEIHILYLYRIYEE